MIKKIVIVGLIIWGVVFFYQKFLQPTLGSFFGKNKGNVDLFQKSSSLDKVNN